MYHIFIPKAGPFDSDVDIYVPFPLDLLYLIDLLPGSGYKIDYYDHFVCDGGKIDVNC